MDLVDQAGRVSEAFLDTALDRFRQDAASLRLGALMGPLLCSDCGEPVPDERRAAVPGATCCVDCQAAREAAGAIGRQPGAGRWAA